MTFSKPAAIELARKSLRLIPLMQSLAGPSVEAREQLGCLGFGVGLSFTTTLLQLVRAGYENRVIVTKRRVSLWHLGHLRRVRKRSLRFCR